MWEKRAKKRSLVGTFELEIFGIFSLCLLDKVFVVGFEMDCVIGEISFIVHNYRK